MKVFKNYIYNVIFQLLNIVLPLVTVPYVSRVLGPNGVGINSYTNSIIQYFILFGGMGTAIYGNRQIAYSRDNPVDRSKNFWEIEIVSVVTAFTAYCFFIVFLLFTDQYHIYYLEQSILVISVAADISWFFMGLENFKLTVMRNIIVKFLSVIAIFSMVHTKNDVGVYILILTTSQLLGNLSLWTYLKKYIVKVNMASLRPFKHLKFSMQFFLPQIAIQVYVVLNRTMLGIMDGPAASGFYESSDKIIRVVLSLVTALGTVMLPHVAHAYYLGQKEKVNKYLRTSFDLVSIIVFPISLGLIAISGKLAPWFFGESFNEVGVLIMIEAVAVIPIAWTNIIGQQYLLPTNKVKQYTVSVIIGAIVNLVLNIPMIYLLGVYGAMIVTVISELCVNGYQLYAISRYIDIKQLFKDKFYYLVASIVMCLVIILFNRYLTFNFITLLFDIVIGLVSYLFTLNILLPDKKKLLIEYLFKRGSKE